MTFILGAKCSNGVVLIGDRKLTTVTGALVGYTEKIRHVPPIVIGSSGVAGVFEKFQTKLTHYRESNLTPDQPIPVEPLIEEIERIMGTLNYTYGESVGGVFNALIAMQTSQGSLLQIVHPTNPMGLAETVKGYQTIGSGSPYAKLLMEMMWRPDLTMQTMANIGYFIIRCFEEYPTMDNAVGVNREKGGKPQVWFIPNDSKNEAIVEQKDLDNLDSTTTKRLAMCRTKLDEIFDLHTS